MSLSQGRGSQVYLKAKKNGESSSRQTPAEKRWKDGSTASQTILFIDDDPDILKVRRLVFEVVGYSVLTAGCGQEALEMLQSHTVDAVVLDYVMLGMDGEETARRIRATRPNLPIILSSNCLSVPQRVLEIVSGSVNKGMRQEILLEVLQQKLARAPDAASRQHAVVRFSAF